MGTEIAENSVKTTTSAAARAIAGRLPASKDRMRALSKFTFALTLLSSLTLAAFSHARAPQPGADSYPKPARQFLAAEQQLNDLNLISEAYIPPTDSAIPVEFQPQSEKSFAVPFIPIPLEAMNLLGARDDAKFLFDGRYFRFLVHPASILSYRDLIKRYGLFYADYRAASTSSSRSVIVWRESEPGTAYSVKLSLNVMQSGRTREVTPAESLHAVIVDKLLEGDARDLEKTTGLSGISESFAATPRDVAAGLIVKRLSNSDLLFKPVFAAFSKKNGTRLSYLERVAAERGETVFQTAHEFAQALLVALNSHYLATGIIPEPHSQNLLYRRVNGRWVFRFRDYSGAAVNYDLRAKLDLDNSVLEAFQNRPEFNYDYEIARGQTYFQKAMTLHFYRGVVSSIDRAYALNGQLELALAISIQGLLDEENRAAKRRKPFKFARSCEALFSPAGS